MADSPVDPVFAALAAEIYPGADPRELWAVAKSMPGVSDVSTPGGDQKKNKRLAAVGLGATGVAGVAGVHAISATLGENKARAAKVAEGAYKAPKILSKIPAKRAAAITAGAALGLHGVELVGDALAARSQARELKKRPGTPVAKAKIPHVAPEAIVRANSRARRVGLRLVGATGVTAAAGGGYAAGRHTRPPRVTPTPTGEVVKRGIYRNVRAATEAGRKTAEDVQRVTGVVQRVKGKHLAAAGGATLAGLTLGPAAGNYVGARAGVKAGLKKQPVKKGVSRSGEICKIDEDKRLAFGWCSLSVVDGQPVVDLQGDVIEIGEIEKAAYSYMLNSRKGGHMHTRLGKGYDGGPVHVADVVESVVFTPEKIEALGLDPDAVPQGWFLGMKIHDEDVWQKVKSGELSGFSIHGSGTRKSISL